MDIDYLKLYGEYKKGVSANQIGKRIDKGAGTIIHHFKRLGLTVRTIKQSRQLRNESYKDKIRQTLKRKHANGELTTWQKGLTKQTDERIKKLSERNKHIVDSFGYKRVWYKGKRVFEHHKVWCETLGWHCIPEGNIIHHKDGNKINNEFNNLVIMSRAEHAKQHYDEQLKNNINRKYWGKNNGRI